MSAFNDAQCQKCNRRFGWSGKITDRPPCPSCGHVVSQQDLETDELEMERFRQFLRERKKGAS